MAKASPEKVAEAPAAVEETQTAFPLSLTEFCTRLSETERRHALIAGFYYTENAAGKTKDLASEYAKRFAEFLETPIR